MTDREQLAREVQGYVFNKQRPGQGFDQFPGRTLDQYLLVADFINERDAEKENPR